MVFKTKEQNLTAQCKYLNDPEKRAIHRERCLAYYYKNKAKISEQRKKAYIAKKRLKDKDYITKTQV